MSALDGLGRQFTVFHATTDAHVESILRGQRANMRGGIETYGPGFYTFHDRDEAEATAHFRAQQRGGRPVVVEGDVQARNPVRMTSLEIMRYEHSGHSDYHMAQYGSQGMDRIRENKRRWASLPDNAIPGSFKTNMLLRQRGHDFLHVDQSLKKRPDIGVALRPKVFRATRVHEL